MARNLWNAAQRDEKAKKVLRETAREEIAGRTLNDKQTALILLGQMGIFDEKNSVIVFGVPSKSKDGRYTPLDKFSLSSVKDTLKQAHYHFAKTPGNPLKLQGGVIYLDARNFLEKCRENEVDCTLLIPPSAQEQLSTEPSQQGHPRVAQMPDGGLSKP